MNDFVYLKVAPFLGILKGFKKAKLAPRFVGPFQIIKRIGSSAYRLALPSKLLGIHDVFHISMLKKCLLDPHQVISWENLQLE